MEEQQPPCPQLITVSYFESQMRVNDTDVTRITICCHINFYMIESCHDRFKFMYLNMSFFSVFRSFFKFDVKKFFHVSLICQWY